MHCRAGVILQALLVLPGSLRQEHGVDVNASEAEAEAEVPGAAPARVSGPGCSPRASGSGGHGGRTVLQVGRGAATAATLPAADCCMSGAALPKRGCHVA